MKQLTLLLLIFSLFTIMAAEEILIDYSPFNVELVSSDSERTVIEYSFGRFNRLPVESMVKLTITSTWKMNRQCCGKVNRNYPPSTGA